VRVLLDRHHGVLHEALCILFEDRFGWETAVWIDGQYVTGPPMMDFPPRTSLTLSSETVREWRPDFVIASVFGTRQPMKALAKEVGAVYVDHVGNAWDAPISDHALRSVAGDYGILYHSEFHRVPYTEPTGNRIGSFHGSLAVSPCRAHWDRAHREHPEWDFQLYGVAENPLYPWQVAQAMADCFAIWHDKDADGYGFTVHETFASGRPVIGHAGHYAGKLAEGLWERGVTYLEPDDDLSKADAAMGQRALARFEALVDFDAEADAIREYLEVLLR